MDALLIETAKGLTKPLAPTRRHYLMVFRRWESAIEFMREHARDAESFSFTARMCFGPDNKYLSTAWRRTPAFAGGLLLGARLLCNICNIYVIYII
jgi:hypothetical protein